MTSPIGTVQQLAFPIAGLDTIARESAMPSPRVVGFTEKDSDRVIWLAKR